MTAPTIARPSTATLLARPRVFRRLDKGRSRTVTWVWGVGGAGKTSAVASYLSARRLRHAWYQLDSGDVDVATFFHRLGQAFPSRRMPLPVFTPEYRANLVLFARQFARAITARLKPPCSLVIDNCHAVAASADVHEVLRILAEELPRGTRLICISRTEPPAAFARLRSQRAVDLVGWDDLRFTTAECVQLVRRLTRNATLQARAGELQARTDGWAAGLVLTLDALERQGESAALPHVTAPEVFDYFAREVFRELDGDTRQVLLQAAVWPRFTGPMAVALTGLGHAASLVDTLHQQNQFTHRSMGEVPTYELHDLFRAFLRAEAARQLEPETHRAIIRRAGTVAEQAGDVDTAVPLFAEAHDWAGLTAAICRAAPVLLQQGRGQTLVAWLEQVPEPVVQQVGWLLYWRGVCALGGRPAQCRLDEERALDLFRQSGDAAGAYLAWTAIVFSHIYEGNSTPLDAWARVFEGLRRELPEFPNPVVEAWAATAMLAVITWRLPEHPDGRHWAARATTLAASAPDPLLMSTATVSAFAYRWQMGEMTHTMRAYEEMRTVMEDRTLPPATSLHAAVTVSGAEWVLGLASYRETVDGILAYADASGVDHTARFTVLSQGTFSALAAGDVDSATRWLAQLGPKVGALGAGFQCWHAIGRTWLTLLRGRTAAACLQVPEMVRLAVADGWPADEVMARALAAHVLHHDEGRRNEAWAHVRAAQAVAHRVGSPFYRFSIGLVEAQLLLAEGRERETVAVLRDVLAVGRTGAFTSSPVWSARAMTRVLALALEHGVEPEYVLDLVRQRQLPSDAVPGHVEAWPRPVKMYTLGRVVVLKDGQPLSMVRKAQKRPLALLKALVAFGGRGVRETAVLDALWPRSDRAAARVALASTVLRLRRMLGHDGAVGRQGGELSLDARHCWVDLWAVERLLGQAEAAWRDESGPTVAGVMTEKAVRMYGGEFLPDDDDVVAGPARDRVRRRLLRQLLRLGQHHERQGDDLQATAFYERAADIDSCAEDVCRLLMTTYHRIGRPVDVASAYRRLDTDLQRRLQRRPSTATAALFSTLSR